jgi:hypothetical protein
MSLTSRELQKIRGIGEVLSVRLLEAGHDSFAKIAALGEEGLKGIAGINPRAVPDILDQARRLAGEERDEREEKTAALKESLRGLRTSVQELTATARERFSEKLAGKTGRKLTDSLVRFIEALETVEGNTGRKLKRAGKGVRKAEVQLEGLAKAGLKELRRGLKKARKALQKVQQ